MKAVDPSVAVAIIGTPICPGLLFMPSNRVAVLEIKISNEAVCAREKDSLQRAGGIVLKLSSSYSREDEAPCHLLPEQERVTLAG